MVALRVAPVLTHHHLQLAQQLLTVDLPGNIYQEEFIVSLKAQAAGAGIERPVHLFRYDDMWAQDFFEPGYTSIPGPNGPIALRVMIRSSQEERVAGRQVFTQLRSETVGAIQYLAAGGSQDAGGNLEAIPPYAYDEKTYPARRVIMGFINRSKPYMMEFLEAQETQAPIELDTTWLLVGHVDEFIQFLPADNRLGWVMAVSDPLSGIGILQDAQAAGFGNISPFSHPKNAADPTVCESKDIDEMLDHTNLVKVNTYYAEQIESNIKIIRREINITDEEIIRIPAVYDDGALECWETQPARNSSEESLQDHLQPAANAVSKLRRRDRDTDIAAVGFYPGIVNGVPLSDTVYLAPNPWGPVINSQDILADAVTAAYAKANYTVNYMEDWFSHHLKGGDIHCGTNTLRDTTDPWW